MALVMGAAMAVVMLIFMRGLYTRLITIFVISVLFNFPWEVVQMPLYVEDGNLLEFAAHCFVPSLGDGIIVLIIFGVGWLVQGRSDWSDRPGITGYALMLFTGFAIAVIIEWGAVYVIERWSYTANMPQLPGLGVGVVPILQMVVLPPLIFKLTGWWLKRRRA